VIKTGLRKISVSYSRISLVDVCKKLSLDTIDEAECIVAKARLAIRCDPPRPPPPGRPCAPQLHGCPSCGGPCSWCMSWRMHIHCMRKARSLALTGMVGQAIRDGVIEAVIDHDTRSVQSKVRRQ
jgi:hypothetical protein